jgi:hypothetical protein
MTDSTDGGVRIYSISDIIRKILILEVPLDIDTTMLHSWGYGLGKEYLEPKQVYTKNQLRKFQTQELDPSNFRGAIVPDIKGELSQKIIKSFLFGDEHYFVLQLHADKVLESGYNNLVVTNYAPTDRYIRKLIQSQKGTWKF